MFQFDFRLEVLWTLSPRSSCAPPGELFTVGRLYNVIMSSEESSESTWRVLEEKYVVIPTHIKICFLVLLVTSEFVSLQKLTNQPWKNIRICGKSVRRYNKEHVSLKERQEQFEKYLPPTQNILCSYLETKLFFASSVLSLHYSDKF